ncbi:Protein TIC 21 like [Actinidia chinensis var. chinensis]|uniref:Protein TIC 21 like n=1 Tax=Actinidia chinensis var. chinensis TaxID=1590841 RepID=A0A2R6Q6A2_ACTCC|nr:Protein TIC 21 like [Actinidia chinensis var. chinensis]
MQALLSPAARPGGAALSPSLSASSNPSPPYLHRLLRPTPSAPRLPPLSSFSLSSLKPLHSLSSLSISLSSPHTAVGKRTTPLASAPISTAYTSSPNDDPEKAKLAQVSKRLESTSRYFKRLGSFGFWGQLVCTVIAAVILSFSVVITGKITSPATFYATAGGIAAGFVSVFWSFGYIRLSDKLRRTANDPSKAPPRADVVKSLKNGIVLNLLGMGAAVLGMQATVGLLVAKALTSSANPYYQGISPGYSPVLALDVFLVQASANTILSHFMGLASSLELLRSVTLPPSESTPIPRIA